MFEEYYKRENAVIVGLFLLWNCFVLIDSFILLPVSYIMAIITLSVSGIFILGCLWWGYNTYKK
jgi:hypothetical protein